MATTDKSTKLLNSNEQKSTSSTLETPDLVKNSAKLEHQKIYRAIEKYESEPRIILFRYIKTNYYGGEPMLAGIDLTTGFTCSLFTEMWEFQELSLLERELW